MEQRGGEGNYLDLAWGREKMAGKVVKKREEFPFSSFFFSPPSHGGTRAEFKSPTQARDSFY